MKECEDLNSSEMALLIICCDVCDNSPNCHRPREDIIKKIQLKKPMKILKTLISNGFVIKHPTSGSMTYAITKKGIECVNRFRI